MRHTPMLILCALFALSVPIQGHALSWTGTSIEPLHFGETDVEAIDDGPAIYSFPVNTFPDGWAALKAEPWGGSRRLTKVYDGTLFLVIGAVPGWKLVKFKSGERGWIAERLVGCCRPRSH